jgi:hypothetical protein
MGNVISQDRRRCGLCFFELKDDAPFLSEPLVSRVDVHAKGSWKLQPLDNLFQYSETSLFIKQKTTLETLRISINRGCPGCSAIEQAIRTTVQQRGHSLDEECKIAPCEINLLVGSRPHHDPSLQVELVVDAGGQTYFNELISLTIGYDGWQSGEMTSRTWDILWSLLKHSP